MKNKGLRKEIHSRFKNLLVHSFCNCYRRANCYEHSPNRFLGDCTEHCRAQTTINKIIQLKNDKYNLKDKNKFWGCGSHPIFNPQHMDFWVFWVLEHRFQGLRLILNLMIDFDNGLAMSGSTYFDEIHDFKDYWKEFTLSKLIKSSNSQTKKDFLDKNQELLLDLITFFCLLQLLEITNYDSGDSQYLNSNDIDEVENLYFHKFLENQLNIIVDAKLVKKILQKFEFIKEMSLQRKFDLSYQGGNLSFKRRHKDITYNQDNGKLGIVSEEAAAIALTEYSEGRFDLRSEEVEFLLYKKIYLGEVTYLKGKHPRLESNNTQEFHIGSLWADGI